MCTYIETTRHGIGEAIKGNRVLAFYMEHEIAFTKLNGPTLGTEYAHNFLSAWLAQLQQNRVLPIFQQNLAGYYRLDPYDFSGYAAIVKLDEDSVVDLNSAIGSQKNEKSLVLVDSLLANPENQGRNSRTAAESLGVDFILRATDCDVDGAIRKIYHPRAVNHAHQGLTKVIHCYDSGDLVSSLQCLKDQGFSLVVADFNITNSTSVHRFQWPNKVALVIGNEHEGIPEPIIKMANSIVYIPSRNGLSLSAPVATGILLAAYNSFNDR